MFAPDAPDEAERLRQLRALEVLDTPAEPLFDQFTRLAAQLCGTSMALISLVDADRQWFKANVGLQGTAQTPREVSFCTHTIRSEAVMEIDDAALDPRFAANPLVTGEPRLRFYAGAPLKLPGGARIGTLCVLDRQPHRLSGAQREQLQTLAQAVVEALRVRKHLAATQRADLSRLRQLLEFSPVAMFHTDAEGQCTYANPSWQQLYGMSLEEALGAGWSRHLHPEDRDAVFRAWSASAQQGAQHFDEEFRVSRPDGSVRRVRAQAKPLHDAQGRLEGYVGAVHDITERDRGRRMFRDMAESAPVGVFRCDLDGRTTYVNAAWSRIYGMPVEQALGWGWVRAVHPDDAPAAAAAWQAAVAQGGDYEIRNRVRHDDGTVRSVHVRARRLHADDGAPGEYVGVIVDTTAEDQARREAELALLQLSFAGDVAGVGGWRVELEPQTTVHWSDTTARIHDRPPGYQPGLDEAIGYYAAEARPVITEAFEAAMRDGSRFQLELPLDTASGRRTWVRAIGQGLRDDPAGPIARVVGAFSDISLERAAEDLRRAHETRLRRLYERTPALLMTFDVGGRIDAVSDLLLQRLGRSRSLPQDQRLEQWLDAPSATAWQRHTLPALFAIGRLERQPCTLLHAQGRPVKALLSAAVEPAQGQRPAYALAVLEDITSESMNAAALRQEQTLRLQLQAHARDLHELVKERGEMLDVLAHEVRQPLNNASAALQAASQGLTGEAVQPLRAAQQVLAQVRAGVDNTLAAAALLAGGEAPALEDVDVDLLVAIAIGDLGGEGKERIEVQRHSSTRTVHADFGLTRLALRNLLANALTHTEGPVQLLLSDSDAPLALMLDIVDSGTGIAATMQDRLFQRGVRGAPTSTRGSHGLGLYIARTAMELQGGRAMLLRTGADGTTMRLQLPVG